MINPASILGMMKNDRARMEPYIKPSFADRSDRQLLEFIAGNIHFLRYMSQQVFTAAETNPLLRSFLPERSDDGIE